MSLISILVFLLIFAFACWGAFWILGQMGLPEPINMVARIIVGVILLLILLGFLLHGMGGVPNVRIGGLTPVIG